MKSEMVRFTWGYREERVIFEYFGLIGLNLLVIINTNRLLLSCLICFKLPSQGLKSLGW